VTLSDVNPGELVRYVRTHTDLQATKLIATSGGMTDAEVHSLRQDGFEGLLRKPFDIHQVITAIEDAVAIVY